MSLPPRTIRSVTVHVTWVRYGRLAVEALTAEIAAAKRDDPLVAVNVVVPSNHVGVTARRLLGSGAVGPTSSRGVGLAAVTFLTVYRMAELLGSAALAGQGRRPVSTPVIGAALRAALRERPGVFAPVAEHPATESSLVAAYREMRDVSPGALRRLGTRSRRAADVVALHDLAHARLEGEFYDEQDLVASAIERLDAGEGRETGLDGPVVVYLPQRLSLHSAALLRAVARGRPLRVIAGSTGHPGADAMVGRSVARIDDTGRLPLALGPSLAPAFDTRRTRVVTTSDADEEVRTAVRVVVDAARTGSPLERIAVLYPTAEPYARLAHEHLSAAGISHNGAAVDPLTSRLAGRTLLGFLRLPEGGYRRDEIFAWLAGGLPRHRGRRAPVVAWERVSREAGVVAGRAHWDRLLTTHAADCDGEAEASEGDPDAVEWRADQLRTEAERARSLREFVLGIIDDLDGAASAPRPWAQRAAWARRCLADLLGSERHRTRWPITEQRAAERVERALDRLAALDGVEGPVALEVFTRTLELELEADLGRVGRMGEGVVVGSLGMGVGLDLDVVVVLGLAEGSLPSRVREDSLLPDAEREATGDELPRRSDESERQHHDLLATLGGAQRHVLCVPRGDLRRNSDRVPSRWVLEIAGDLEGRRVTGVELMGTRRPMARARGLVRRRPPSRRLSGHRAGVPVAGDACRRFRRARRVGRRIARRRNRPGWPGRDRVASSRSLHSVRREPRGIGHPVARRASRRRPPRLEGWARCPFAYLVRDVLGVEEVENPEDRLEISPLDQGTLVHLVLERFVQEHLDRRGASPAEGSALVTWTEEDGIRLREIAHEECDRYQEHGLVGRPIFWQRDRRRIVGDLERFLRERRVPSGNSRPTPRGRGARLRASRRLPPHGYPRGCRTDASVEFRGKADRLDVADDGTIEVARLQDRPRGLLSGAQRGQSRCSRHETAARRLWPGGAAARAEARCSGTGRVLVHVPQGPVPPHRLRDHAEVLERVSETVGRIVDGHRGWGVPEPPHGLEQFAVRRVPLLRPRRPRRRRPPSPGGAQERGSRPWRSFLELVAKRARGLPGRGKGRGIRRRGFRCMR